MLNKNQKNCGRNLKDVSAQLQITVGFAAPNKIFRRINNLGVALFSHGISTSVGFVVFIGGIVYFRSVERYFADVI
ncbi:MAG: hypothetical protein HW415_454 [Deltaproteobacteria bacterium]|nr:hypothetical protein [Deltaproteobacteria bacterium]